MPRVSGRRFSALEIGTWSFANLDVFLTSFSPLASLLHSHSSFIFFFSFLKSTTLVLRVPNPGPFYYFDYYFFLFSRLLSSFLPLCILSLFLSLLFLFLLLSFSFFCFVRVAIQYLFTQYTCTNCENGIPRTLKDNCFPIDLRSRLLAIRHCICTFALRQHQRCHVWW